MIMIAYYVGEGLVKRECEGEISAILRKILIIII